MASELITIYKLLLGAFGPQYWWPGESQFEIIIGAVLTQNTNWQNVSKAIDNLKQEELLSPEVLYHLPGEILAEKIRPSGYYNLKAGRIKNLLHFLKDQCDNHQVELSASGLEKILKQEVTTLRKGLLSVKGIGPETADSILLYAGEKPVFVVDNYTQRLLLRHNLIFAESSYEDIQEFFTSQLQPEVKLFNEYHALIVKTGKDFCKKSKPRCSECPLGQLF
jgi:endonuclease III related protein